MRRAFAATATQLLETDPSVALVLADISTQYFEQALHSAPQRAVNVGIMEATMIGVAAGFAIEGYHVIAHSLSPFVAERPYEQLKLDFGYQGLGGTFVGSGASYDYATEGGTHHAPGDVQALLAIPGMEVLIPGHATEVETLLRSVHKNGRATYMRTSDACNDDALAVAPGRLEVVRRGVGPTVLAFGPTLSPTLEACEGLDSTVAYATSLEPFDAAGLTAIAGRHPHIVVIEPFYEGASAHVVVGALSHTAARWSFIGVPRAFVHDYGTRQEIDALVGLDTAGIHRRIRQAIAAAA